MNRLAPLLLAATLAPALALADERPYAFTYEATVSAAGEKELELYETYYVPDSGTDTARKAVHQLEFGYGVTDQFDLALYGVFQSTTAEPFQFQALKLRGRYKVASAATAPLDLVLYLEGEKEVVDDKPWALEEKIIFGRDIGKFGFSVNLVAEQEFVGGETIFVWGWAAGVNVAVSDHFRLGAETFGEWETEAGVTTTQAFAGPSAVVSLPFLRFGDFNTPWLTLGVGFGLNQSSDDVRARALLGVDF
jgi:hypothetical protein